MAPIASASAGELRRSRPRAYRFLLSYRNVLLTRRSSFRSVTEENWSDWMHWTDVHFARKRIVCPYRARSNRFALAPRRALGSIDVGFIVPRAVHPMYLLALLNSRLLERAYHSYAKELASGVYDYYPRNLAKLPIRRIEFESTPEGRKKSVSEFSRALEKGRANSWLDAQHPPDVLHDILVLLAKEATKKWRGDEERICDLIEKIVEQLYRS